MAEPKLVQQQREILRYGVKLSTAYAKIEAEAGAGLNAKKITVEQERQNARHLPDELLARTDAILQEAQNSLSGRWDQDLQKITTPSSSPSQDSHDPLAELQRCVAEAQRSSEEVKKAGAGVRIPPVTSFAVAAVALALGLYLLTNAWLAVLIALPSAFFISSNFDKSQFKKISGPYAKLLQMVEESRHWHGACLNATEKKYQNQIAQVTADYHRRIAVLKREFEGNLTQVMTSVNNLAANADKCSPKWADRAWDDFVPAAALPPMMRLGELKSQMAKNDISMPALFPFPGEHSLLITAPAAAKGHAVAAIQALALRLLAKVPPGKLRFTFLDPVALGQNVAPFMRLADHDETLINFRTWTEPQHIEQQLFELTEHMENVIQKYIRNEFPNLEAYNEQAGEVAEPYRILVAMNFPVNFSDDATRRLVSILQNGPRCGVYALIFYDRDKPLPYGFKESDLHSGALVFTWEGGQFVWQDGDFRGCQFKFEAPPRDHVFNAVIEAIGRQAVAAQKVEVPYTKILERAGLLAGSWWQGSTINGVRVPLGPIGAKKIQFLDLGQGTSQHVLIGGKTGSGKSNLIHVAITGLVLQYSPQELELYLIDFKKGIEFKIYATQQLPHARVIAIESEREFGLSVLEGLNHELKRRGDLFRNAGVDNLKDFRAQQQAALPRMLLLVDEFQEFFTEDDGLAAKAAQILDRLVRQGRAFGIHVVLGSQTLAGSYTLARSTVDQMAVRIALQCSEADSRLILSDDNPAARSLSRPGEAIYNAANGLVEGNNPFQVAFLPQAEQEDFLAAVKAKTQHHGDWPPAAQIVFEGNAPSDPERHWALNEFLLHPRWTTDGKIAWAWVGEPIAIKEATVAGFRRQSGSHLLIVGQKEEAALGILAMSLLSLSVQHPRRSAKFYVLDFGAVDAGHADFFASLARVVPQNFISGRRRQLPETIAAIADEIERRLAGEDSHGPEWPATYLIVHGLQRARDLQPDEALNLSWSGEQQQPSLSAQFAKILREGPEVGVHCLVWCDTLQNVQRRLERQALREFDLRIAFQMSHDDAMNFADSPAAGKLGENRALFYSEETGRAEKFRPYALPSGQWLQKIGQVLGA